MTKFRDLHLSDGNGTKISLTVIWWMLTGLIVLLFTVAGTLAWSAHLSAVDRVKALEDTTDELRVRMSEIKAIGETNTDLLQEVRADVKTHILRTN